MEEQKRPADRADAMAAAAKKTMGHVGALAYELNRAEYGLSNAIARSRALHLVGLADELQSLARRLERATAALQPAIFVEAGALPGDPDA